MFPIFLHVYYEDIVIDEKCLFESKCINVSGRKNAVLLKVDDMKASL
jgi:hypothetical protein